MANKTIWKGKSRIAPNIWGLTSRNRTSSGFTMVYGMGYSGNPGLLATFILAILCLIFYTFFISFFSTILAVIYPIIHVSCMLYWFIIREIKYFQLTKNTEYEILENEIIFKHKFLGLKRELKINFLDIYNFHLVKYQEKDEIEGSIWIYTHSEIKTFDLRKRERNNIPKIQMIKDYQPVLRTLLQLKNKNQVSKS